MSAPAATGFFNVAVGFGLAVTFTVGFAVALGVGFTVGDGVVDGAVEAVLVALGPPVDAPAASMP
jgi:hypothetical protein